MAALNLFHCGQSVKVLDTYGSNLAGAFGIVREVQPYPEAVCPGGGIVVVDLVVGVYRDNTPAWEPRWPFYAIELEP